MSVVPEPADEAAEPVLWGEHLKPLADRDAPVIPKDLGTRIAIAQACAGMNTSQLARELDVSQPSMSHYRSNRLVPSLEIVEHIGMILGVSTHWLMAVDEHTSAAERERLS